MCSTLGQPAISDHPVDIGLRSEGAVLGRLVEHGHHVLAPFGVNQRYDLVIERDGQFLTAQCKTGRLRNGVVKFSAQSVQSNTNGTRFRSYAGQVDLFIVYCPDNRQVYVIPGEEVPSKGGYLRIDPPRNGQRKRVRWAKDYELPA
jgi:hypothetical protein